MPAFLRLRALSALAAARPRRPIGRGVPWALAIVGKLGPAASVLEWIKRNALTDTGDLQPGSAQRSFDGVGWTRDAASYPKRRASAFGGQPRHLLTNLLRCGLCLSHLVAKGAGGRKNGQGYWTYGCVRDPARPMVCGKVWIKGSSTDAYIESLVKAALLDNGVSNAMHPEGRSGPSEDATSAMRARYRELRDLLLEREKAALCTTPIRSWEDADLGQRRAIIRLLMPDIRVQAARSMPSLPQRWNPDRIDITLA